MNVQIHTRDEFFMACVGCELKYENSFPFFKAIPKEFDQIIVLKSDNQSDLILELLLTLIGTPPQATSQQCIVHFQACPTVKFSFARNNVYFHVVMYFPNKHRKKFPTT
ncbi:hypothetical protein BT93_E2149 [Corymbia citriodora subsp. variegata]|nr:hypothetical protein BT93_E2149 [Corymbia citriodora subsp. variegata]